VKRKDVPDGAVFSYNVAPCHLFRAGGHDMPSGFVPPPGHSFLGCSWGGGNGPGSTGEAAVTVHWTPPTPPTQAKPVLSTDKKLRKESPMARGVLDYFPRAVMAIANVSFVGNEQHNPGQPMHWARDKSTDHADCILRHLAERGTVDDDGLRHSAKVAWRALALLETELEALEGA
jgi:hypothetical protein